MDSDNNKDTWFVSEDWPKGFSGGAIAYLIDCYQLMTEVLTEEFDFEDDSKIEVGISNWPDLESMAYLYRRLGPTKVGHDDYKEICMWVVGTPEPQVKLYVGVNSVGFTVAFLVGPELRTSLHEEYFRDGGVVTDRVRAAVKAACKKLAEEVTVRDRSFTIYG